jgi:hypothetical protein
MYYSMSAKVLMHMIQSLTKTPKNVTRHMIHDFGEKEVKVEQ